MKKQLNLLKRKKMIRNKDKSGQVTIFIIIAIILVALMFVLFFLWPDPYIRTTPESDPSAYIEKCLRDYTKEAIDILSEQGADIDPEGSVLYNNKDITYLCYNDNYYKTCINQRPMLIEHIEQEITDYIEPRVQQCFSSLKQELEDRRYSVRMGSMEIITELQSKTVNVEVKRDMEMKKNENTRKFENFGAKISNPIYDLAEIAMEIANQEARYCNFDVVGFMITYPDYNVDKLRLGDSSTIYTLKDIPTGKSFTFATRSCAMPGGI